MNKEVYGESEGMKHLPDMKEVNRLYEIKELEIRAAKCLGWKEHVYVECIMYEMPESGRGSYPFNHRESPIFYRVIELKFTTSYDWAMLLVKEVIKRETAIPFTHPFSEPYWHTANLTPEQITRAAVEVLEAQ